MEPTREPIWIDLQSPLIGGNTQTMHKYIKQIAKSMFAYLSVSACLHPAHDCEILLFGMQEQVLLRNLK